MLGVGSTAALPLSGQPIFETGLHEAADCSDGPWYDVSQFDATPNSFLIGFDFVFFTHNAGLIAPAVSPIVLDFVEPPGPTVVINPQFFFNGAICQGPFPFDPAEVYDGINIVAPDVTADFPAPYTLEIE